MSEKTEISWTDATWPVVAGCTKVSPGCTHCWAIRDSWRLSHNPNPKVAEVYAGTVLKNSAGELNWTGVVRLQPQRLDWPLRWKDPRRIFVCSQADLFHEAVPDWYVDHVWATMLLAPRHTFQVLTKRPERMLAYLTAPALYERVLRQADVRRVSRSGLSMIGVSNPTTHPAKWIWLGVTAEDQAAADERIPLLLQTPAAVRFVSCEPLLGPVSICAVPDSSLDWVIVGGESGPRARAMNIQWARSVKDQCVSAGVPFFFKQAKVDGKLAKMPQLDGRTWNEMPEV